MPDKPRIAVAGAINIDILAHAQHPMNLHDSNPGLVRRSFGGVGLNIARNLVLLGADVTLISATGTAFDPAELPPEAAQMDLTQLIRRKGFPTSTYVALHDEDGDMFAAVSDMRIYDTLEPGHLEHAIATINAGDALVVDTNLNDESVRFLTEHVTVPIVCDPVSIAKSARIAPYLNRLSVFKPNLDEASALLGQTIRTDSEAEHAVQAFLDMGIRLVCLSMGSRGMLVGTNDKRLHAAGTPRFIASATGAGDAMTAALTYAYVRQLDLHDLARCAIGASLVTLEHEQAVNPLLNLCYDETIQRRITLTYR